MGDETGRDDKVAGAVSSFAELVALKPDSVAPRDGPLKKPSVVAVLITALVARGVAMLWLPSAFANDIDGYLRLAGNLVEHGVLGVGNSPTALRPPLYPLLLAPLSALPAGLQSAGIAMLHLFLGVATVGLTLHVGRRLRLGGWCTVAGLLVAVDPLLVYWGTQIMTETLYAFLLTLTVAALVEYWLSESRLRFAIAAGGFAGLAALCRPECWLFIAAMFALLLVQALCGDGDYSAKPQATRISIRGRLLEAHAVPVMALLVCLPWALRNWSVLGWPVLTTTHGGYTLLLANNPVFYREVVNGPLGATWEKTSNDRWRASLETRFAGLSEIARDRACYREALGNIRAQPVDFLRSIRLRVARLWRPVPHVRDVGTSDPSPGGKGARFAVGGFYSVELILLLVSLVSFRTWRSPWLVLPLLLGTTTLVHAFYWSNMRMRAGVMPAVALMVAGVVAKWRHKS